MRDEQHDRRNWPSSAAGSRARWPRRWSAAKRAGQRREAARARRPRRAHAHPGPPRPAHPLPRPAPDRRARAGDGDLRHARPRRVPEDAPRRAEPAADLRAERPHARRGAAAACPTRCGTPRPRRARRLAAGRAGQGDAGPPAAPGPALAGAEPLQRPFGRRATSPTCPRPTSPSTRASPPNGLTVVWDAYRADVAPGRAVRRDPRARRRARPAALRGQPPSVRRDRGGRARPTTPSSPPTAPRGVRDGGVHLPAGQARGPDDGPRARPGHRARSTRVSHAFRAQGRADAHGVQPGALGDGRHRRLRGHRRRPQRRAVRERAVGRGSQGRARAARDRRLARRRLPAGGRRRRAVRRLHLGRSGQQRADARLQHGAEDRARRRSSPAPTAATARRGGRRVRPERVLRRPLRGVHQPRRATSAATATPTSTCGTCGAARRGW